MSWGVPPGQPENRLDRVHPRPGAGCGEPREPDLTRSPGIEDDQRHEERLILRGRVASGVEVRAGERFGIMKFGSRMDVFVPPSATIKVKVGEFVRGGETIIAVLH